MSDKKIDFFCFHKFKLNLNLNPLKSFSRKTKEVYEARGALSSEWRSSGCRIEYSRTQLLIGEEETALHDFFEEEEEKVHYYELYTTFKYVFIKTRFFQTVALS